MLCIVVSCSQHLTADRVRSLHKRDAGDLQLHVRSWPVAEWWSCCPCGPPRRSPDRSISVGTDFIYSRSRSLCWRRCLLGHAASGSSRLGLRLQSSVSTSHCAVGRAASGRTRLCALIACLSAGLRGWTRCLCRNRRHCLLGGRLLRSLAIWQLRRQHREHPAEPSGRQWQGAGSSQHHIHALPDPVHPAV